MVDEVTEDTFTVYTLDNGWIDEKTGKPSGGCTWTLTHNYAKEFKERSDSMSRLLYWGKDPSPDEWKKLTEGKQVSTYSEIMSRRRCLLQHHYAYVQKLEKKTPGLPLTLGSLGHTLLEAKYREGDWRPALTQYVEDQWVKLFDEQRFEYGDLPGEMARLLTGYDYHWRNEKWIVIDTEVSFLAKLTEKAYLAGKIDLVVEDSNGKLWVVDHKFVKQRPDDDFLMMELQTTLYYWVSTLKYGKDEVAGIILNYIKTKAPTIPSLNKDGTMSKAKIDTDLATLVQFFKDNNLNPKDYKEQVDRAKVTSQDFYVRKRLDRPVSMLKVALREAVATIMDIYSDRPVSRTAIKQCSWDCNYQPLCLGELQENDVSFTVAQKYVKKDSKHQEVVASGNEKQTA